MVGTQEDWTVSHISTAKKKNLSAIAILYVFRKYPRYLNMSRFLNLALDFILCQNKRDGNGIKAGVTLTKKPLNSGKKKKTAKTKPGRFTIPLMSQANEITQVNRRKITMPICSINWKVICCSLLSSGPEVCAVTARGH